MTFTKLKGIWKRLSNSYVVLLILVLCCFIVGQMLFLYPETTSIWFIKVTGLLYIYEGILYCKDMGKKLMNKEKW